MQTVLTFGRTLMALAMLTFALLPPMALAGTLGMSRTTQSHSTPSHTTPSKAQTSNRQNTPPLEVVRVVGSRQSDFTEITKDTQKLIDMPGALGDPLGAISSLPGVVATSAVGSPAVRGSSPSDNRYYVDGVPAGYIFHKFNTSIFNENVVQDFKMYSAGFGAQYADVTGAVFDIRLRDPRNQPVATTVDMSLLRAGVFVEGGVTDNSAAYLSARKGLIQYWYPTNEKDGVKVVSPPEDNDYQGKYQWHINDDDTLTLNLSGAGDYAAADFTDTSNLAQANPDFAGHASLDKRFDSQGLQWSRYRDDGSEAELTAAHYTDNQTTEGGLDYFQKMHRETYLERGHYRLPLGEKHALTLGGEYDETVYDYSGRIILFVCTEFNADCQDGRRDLVQDTHRVRIGQHSLYLTDNWLPLPSVLIEAGMQWHGNDYTDETFRNPRLAIEWTVNDSLVLTTSAGHYDRLQDIDKLLPVIGNPHLKSQRATHYTLGAKGNVNAYWNWSVETYYKTLSDLPLGLSASAPDASQLYSNDVKGTARGIDILINKDLSDRWYGWAALSYSQSKRTNLRTGTTQNYTFDTPIVFNMVGSYQFSAHWSGGFRFIATSGKATTEIIGIKQNPDFPGNYLPVYGKPYRKRLPPYIRLDLRAERKLKIDGHNSRVYMDVINALNRRNVVGHTLDYNKVNATGQLHTQDSVDIGIVPSVGISVTFD